MMTCTDLFYYRVFSLLLVLADIVIVIVDLATAGHAEQVNDGLSTVVVIFYYTATSLYFVLSKLFVDLA